MDNVFLFRQPVEEGEIISWEDYKDLKNAMEKNEDFLETVKDHGQIAISYKSVPYAEDLFDQSNNILIEAL